MRFPARCRDLEKFLHDDPEPTLRFTIKAALAHVQFETIHSFLDGNGLVGRLLITLLLIDQQVLGKPLLYLSLYLKRNRSAYYEHLQRVRTHGEWEESLRFFLAGVVEVANQTAQTTREIVEMVDRDRNRIHGMGRGAATTLRVHDYAVRRVVIKPRPTAAALDDGAPGLCSRTTPRGGRHPPRDHRSCAGQTYAYTEYLDTLNEGTEH